MGRILATLGILVLLSIPLVGTQLPGMRQGAETGKLRADDPDAVGKLGEQLPDLEFIDLAGAPVRLSDLRGHRVLLVFERNLDW